ncbi:MarR family transcriptional regulator [Arthrobacter sp. NPDC089319]|uniref:MarR family winged helix-turn-helix transcriptional regulator n=1 Tax=Arthrobacter sp. NPDC089319 TaxID=3155915 RepID=UPI003413B0D4
MPDLSNWPMSRLLSTAARLVEYAWDESLASLNLTHAGVIVLEVLAAEGEMTQSRLADRVRVEAQTMGKTVARLEACGHVARARSEADRRQQLVSVSEQGVLALEKAARLEHLLIGDDRQRAALKAQLSDIIRNTGNKRFRPSAP